MTLDFVKKHWASALHIIAAVAMFEDAAVRQYFVSHPQYAGLGLVVWAEVMHWLQSPKNVPQPKPAPTPINEQ